MQQKLFALALVCAVQFCAIYAGIPTSAAGMPKESYLTFSLADGTGDYVQVNNAQAIGSGGAVTVSAWVKVDVNSVAMTFVAKGRSGLESWVLRRISNNRMSFSVRNAAGTLVSADSPNNFGNDLAWHHLAGVYDGAAVSIYLDGSSVGTISRPLTGNIRDNTTPICFGTQTSGSGCGTSTFRGSLDEVQIWDRALTQAEIQGAMNIEAAGNEPGLKAYWKLNDASGQTALNQVSSLQNGRLGASVGDDSNDPFWASAIIDTTGPEITSVTASNITPVQATIAWSTNELSTTQVEYGTDTTYGSSSPLNQAFVFSHSAVLSNLLVNTTYHYRAVSRDMAGNQTVSPDFQFTTLPEPDTTAPSATITYPLHGGTVSQIVSVTALASDNISVSRVDFAVDGVLAASDVSSPYSFTWNSLAVTDGAHSLTATASDDAGNSSSSMASVTVDNVCDPGEPFVFATFADNYSGHESGLRRVFDELKQKGARFAISAGDTSTYERIRSVMDPRLNSMQPCGATEFPWYPGAGNHDVEEIASMSAWAGIWAVDWENNAASTRLAMQLPGLTNFKRGPLQVGGQSGMVSIQPGTIYSFDYRNAHFLFVNEYEQGIINDLYAGVWDQNGADVFDPTTSQLDWIKQDLESTDKDARFVIGHVAASTPIYSVTNNPPPGWSEHNQNFKTAALVQLMTANKVSGYFFGHDHVISRRLVNPDKTAAYDKLYWDIASDPNKPVGNPSAWVNLQGVGRVWQADLGSVSSNSGEYMIIKVGAESVTFETYVYREGDVQSQLWDTWTLPIGPNAPVPDMTLPQFSGITVTALTDQSAALSWTTDEHATTQVEYGLTTAYGQATPNDVALTLSHSVNLTGLTPDAVYHYRVKSADAAGNLAVSQDNTFHTQPTPGQSGSGLTTEYLKFDGNDSVRILNSAGFPTGPMTVTAWARTSVNGQSMTIIGKGKSGFEQWVMRRVSSNGRIVFGVRGTGSVINANSPANQGADGLWHHYAGVWDGTTIRLYIDGTDANSTSATLTESMRVDDEPICIGTIAGNTTACTTSGYWNGGIDDVSIWNRALTPAEIQAVMANGLVGSEAGLLSYWNMNEGSGQSLTNLANASLSGVLGTTPNADASDPVWITP